MFSIFIQIHDKLAAWPNPVLSLSLMAAALVLFCIALMKDHEVLKALALAYVVLP